MRFLLLRLEFNDAYSVYYFIIGSFRNLLIIETVAEIKELFCGVVNSPI